MKPTYYGLELGGRILPDTKLTRAVFGNELQRELFFFREANNLMKVPEYTGQGRYFHGRNLVEICWGDRVQWHDYFEATFHGYCAGEREVLVTGPGSAGKTMGAAVYSLLYFMCDPEHTGVLISSTTMRGLRQRIWSDIKRLYNMLPKGLRAWNLVDQPFPALQPSRGDLKHGIIGVAVEQGNEEAAMDRIIGFHPPRILVIVDELTGVPWSIVKATVNLFTGKREAQFIGLGNANSYFDSHGKMCEPTDGWNSVTVDSENWKTKRGGICIHLDGFKSPNVIAGKVLFPYLLTKEDIDITARDYGMNSLDMWRFRRGYWCPEGTVKSIMSETLLTKFRAMDKISWRESFTKVAALDPAFEGGDRCMLKFGKYGTSSEGIDTLQFDESMIVKTDATSKEPVHYQIARQVKEACTTRGIDPQNFAMDVTGEGGGLASILAETWGHGFHHVEFGGKPSDMPVSAVDSRSCREVYHNKVTELWYTFRDCVQQNQIRGLDPDSAVEFCNRLYFSENKIRIEPKSDMKARPGGKSPDNADACVVMVDLVKHKGGFGRAQSRARNARNREWEDLVEEYSFESTFENDPIANV